VKLEPINPLSVTLGIRNASFIAQTVDWNPAHLYATLQAAHRHSGLAFVRVMQRCPHYMPHMHASLQDDPSNLLLLTHPNGIQLAPEVAKMFKNQAVHDPADRSAGRDYASQSLPAPIGLFYRNEELPCYDHETVHGLGMPADDKVKAVQAEVDHFLI
jgi:2-oxoglutarate ferredoxin oxidoreductase subunit beta